MSEPQYPTLQELLLRLEALEASIQRLEAFVLMFERFTKQEAQAWKRVTWVGVAIFTVLLVKTVLGR